MFIVKVDGEAGAGYEKLVPKIYTVYIYMYIHTYTFLLISIFQILFEI